MNVNGHRHLTSIENRHGAMEQQSSSAPALTPVVNFSLQPPNPCLPSANSQFHLPTASFSHSPLIPIFIPPFPPPSAIRLTLISSFASFLLFLISSFLTFSLPSCSSIPSSPPPPSPSPSPSLIQPDVSSYLFVSRSSNLLSMPLIVQRRLSHLEVRLRKSNIQIKLGIGG